MGVGFGFKQMMGWVWWADGISVWSGWKCGSVRNTVRHNEFSDADEVKAKVDGRIVEASSENRRRLKHSQTENAAMEGDLAEILSGF